MTDDLSDVWEEINELKEQVSALKTKREDLVAKAAEIEELHASTSKQMRLLGQAIQDVRQLAG